MEGSKYLASARENEEKASKKEKGSCFINLFSNKEARMEEVKELYEKAANSYKLAQEWEKAGQMYRKCADLERQTNGIPAQYLLDSLTCYKKVNHAEYLALAEETIVILSEDGRLDQAARLRKEVAESYEQQAEYPQAILEYEKAAQLYEMEDTHSFASQCYVKEADLMVMVKEADLVKIIQTYEKVINEYLKKDMLKSSSKGLVLKVCLCYLANDDLVGAKNRHHTFSQEDATFSNSREGELLSSLFTAKELKDVDLFQKTLHDYNKITPLKKEETQLLVQIKDSFPSLGEDLNLAGGDDFEEKEPDFT
ncbi:unnamed protein product [Moneuplotes crassus]|uniref:Gamma-soluble NSF attachment protein n=1 Tax=Euplotes crassus TaxID=5936 RepID=A0AAD1XPV5_EUPCR|nr:unnamed protein product [Moneuplotes crassus]